MLPDILILAAALIMLSPYPLAFIVRAIERRQNDAAKPAAQQLALVAQESADV